MSAEQPPTPTEAERLREENDRLRARLRDLRMRLEEPEDIVRAIRHGEVDAFVVSGPRGEQIYSLRRADVLYRAMVEEMKEGAAAVDRSGTIVYCNAYFAQLVNRDRSFLLGSSIWTFVPEESRDFFEAFEPQSTTRVDRHEVVLRAEGGELVPVVCTVSQLDIGDDEGLFCVMLTDLRRQRREEELLAESRRKDEFLAMLAHELRNPIAPIRTAAELLRVGGSGGDLHVEAARQVIERQVTHMTRLIDDLLDVSRITRGKIRLELERVDLALVVSRSVETVRPLIDARRHQLTLTQVPGPLIVQADVTRLSQVISNVLNNAAKFTPEGGSIAVKVEASDGAGVVRVRDTGIGIPHGMVSRIFDLFTQGDSTQVRAQGGLGIGLTLVRTLVEMHGGTVEASSPGPGQGSEFVIRVPLVAGAAGETAEATGHGERKQAGAATRHKILIVDDNVDAAEMLAIYLGEHEHETRTASEGEGALALVDEFKPDVMLIDIGLPGMSGHELARRLRASSRWAHIALVAVTGYGQQRDHAESRAAGFDHHCVKPISPAALLALLASLPVRHSE